ncbi:MAG: hypothetical protein KC983_02530 [Phycisphaerales bacterium]|nr:hypothetical protein [Phycisphaerales bacterium]
MASVQIRTHCLVLAPRGRADDDRLTAQAAARGWSVRHVHDACLALADLCLRERMARVREADGYTALERQVLLLVEPAAIPRGSAFLEAVRTHAPRTPVWTLTGDQLTPLTTTAAIPAAPTAVTPTAATVAAIGRDLPLARPSHAPPPSLRLTPPEVEADVSSDESSSQAPGRPRDEDFDDAPSTRGMHDMDDMHDDALDDDDVPPRMTTITPEEYDMLFRKDLPGDPMDGEA